MRLNIELGDGILYEHELERVKENRNEKRLRLQADSERHRISGVALGPGSIYHIYPTPHTGSTTSLCRPTISKQKKSALQVGTRFQSRN